MTDREEYHIPLSRRFIIAFPVILILLSVFSCDRKRAAGISMDTDLGEIRIEVYPDKAPVTAGNFLRYVDEGRMSKAVFFRTVTPDNQPDDEVRIEVIRGMDVVKKIHASAEVNQALTPFIRIRSVNRI